MKRKSTAPTMKDVAQEAGVALGTVSKVFNGLPVGEQYKAKVEAAAQKLGYQVNSYARGFKTNRTNTVALIMPSLTHPFFAHLTNELSNVLLRRGMRTMLAITNYGSNAEQSAIDMLRQNKVDGIIALTYSPDLVIHENLPFVSIDRYFGANIPCITSDNFGGGVMAAEKLDALGCKRLLFFRSGSDVSGEPDKRGAGFEYYCQQHGLDYTSLRMADTDGVQPFHDYIEAHTQDGRFDFDGLFCSTDQLAYQIRPTLNRLGIRVPEDLQIIGFDGIRNFGREDLYCSTIVQPIRQLAEAAVDVLLTEDKSKLPALMCLPVSYAAGGSTKE